MLATIKAIGALALGGVVLWQVATHSGPRKCIAYVHVSTAEVEVTIDDAEYRIESLADTPIVCELGAGRHMLRMARDGRLLYEEEFTLAPGKESVLTAWERPGEPRVEDNSVQLTFNEPFAFPLQPARRNLPEAEHTPPGCIDPQ